MGDSNKGEGDRNKFPRWDKLAASKDKGKRQKDDALKKLSSFLCNGPTRSLIGQRGTSLLLLSTRKSGKKKKGRQLSWRLLKAIKAKVEGQPRGHVHMETIVNGKPLQVILDSGADMAKELTKWA